MNCVPGSHPSHCGHLQSEPEDGSSGLSCKKSLTSARGLGGGPPFPVTPQTPQAARPLQQKAGHASSSPVPPGRTAALQRTAQATQLTQGSRGALTQPMLPDSLSTLGEHLCRSASSAATVRGPPTQRPVGAAGGQRRPWPEPSSHLPATPCLGPWHGLEPAALDHCVAGATSRQRQLPSAASDPGRGGRQPVSRVVGQAWESPHSCPLL